MEEELQKRAAAAFEVSTSPNVVEYEQMLFPVSVAGGNKAEFLCISVLSAAGARTARFQAVGWISVVL